MKYRLTFTQSAVRDLNSIVDYLSHELHSPQATADFLKEFDKKTDIIENMPHAFTRYKSSDEFDDDIRWVMVKHYKLFYAITENTVEVRRVLYERRQTHLKDVDPSDDYDAEVSGTDER